MLNSNISISFVNFKSCPFLCLVAMQGKSWIRAFSVGMFLAGFLTLSVLFVYKQKAFGISVLLIYGGHWIGLCAGVRKNCYGQWNCLIWWFELFFLVILSDFGVQSVIGFGRLWNFKRTNGNGWMGPLFAMFSRIELHNF